jgi:hypothetical protein
MEGREQSGSLVPLDMFLRELLRRGELSGSLTLPFFSTVAHEVSTGIQAYRDQAVRLAQDADLCLRRWLYLQAWNPEAGRAVVQELSGVLANGLPLDQLAMLMPDVLDEGRRRGWLQEY